MEKKQYITPDTLIVKLAVVDGMLIGGSDGEGRTLFGTNSRGTSDGYNGVQDVKGQNDYNVWDEDWSK